MNTSHSTYSGPRAGRFMLSAVAAAVMALAAPGSWALGLGRMAVQSALGENLRAEIDVTSITPEEASSLRVRVAPPEAYRAAGVDYGAVLPGTQATLARRADGRSYLRVSSDRVVQEPFVDVILELTWASGRLVREYTMLLDPPSSRAAAPALPPAPAVAPVISAAPSAATAPAPRAVSPAPAPRVASPAPVPGVAAAASPARASRPAAAPAAAVSGDEYRVRTGDTLSRIAARTQREGASLDQMLVALWRNNSQAFIDNNMNRLKAGSVLSVPSTAVAKDIAASEAKQLIQAQSADFGAYRQRLASGAPAVKTSEPARQAAGRVQAQVDDKKAGAATSPDRLTLSQGGLKGATEAKVSKAAETKEQAARVAELARNVEDLKKLKDGAGIAAPKPGAAPVVSAAPVVVAAAPPPVPAPAPVAAVVVPAAPPAPTPAASASAPAAIASAAAPVPAAKPTLVAKPPVAPVGEEPSFISGLLDNPFVLPGAGIVLALLAGLGVYRWRSRARNESGETSFLESRLQPDSFFGASGGQRIDTRDASGASSSMSYSLSQLDAIGDVDPVAEADVYLAYGRDLQAEEILKEAMRGNPDRLAIRTKLLEVYAKRRDTKGFELLATQLFALTKGEGDDWHKVQELGQQIDPDNPMYAPGGRPSAVLAGGAAAVVEPLGASTMPQSVLPTASNYDLPEADDRVQVPPVDLDLDLDLAAAMPSPAKALEITQPIEPAATAAERDTAVRLVDLKLPTGDADAASTTTAAAFDFGSISLDLGNAGQAVTSEPALDYSSMPGALDSPPAVPGDPADPLVRKLELAEEFRQIGDKEGARDLLEEVVAKASGPLKSRAQSLLDGLA
ncbi:MAG: FimV/HubP family polar landmark protein [Burkholderiaceae bacterium]|nr:FimV/HubP family polar landmark protein [Burkholderiaceae bacterium]